MFKSFMKKIIHKKYLIKYSFLYSNIVRILIPLVVTEEQLTTGLDIIENSVEKVNLDFNKNF